MRDLPRAAVSGPDLDALYEAVRSWFAPAALEEAMGPAELGTEAAAREYLATGGKRWRPLLAACAYAALREDGETGWPAALRRTAVAVECFHKASLIHDDIEDGDTERYGRQALHVRLGVAAALNVGDFLVGEGYRLLGDLAVADECKARLLRAAAQGHRSLCLGQGRELEALRAPFPPTVQEVLAIFRGKTGPAFEAAVRVGAAVAGTGEDLWPMLGRYGEALGVAYQIRDDLEDGVPEAEAGEGGGRSRRAGIVLALALERATGEAKALLEDMWRGSRSAGAARELERIVEATRAEEAARGLLESYCIEAEAALAPAADRPLGHILRQVAERMFEGMGARQAQKLTCVKDAVSGRRIE